MTLTRFKSVWPVVRGGAGFLLPGLLLITPPVGESHSATYSASDARSAILQDTERLAVPLQPGIPLERKLAGGESHLYEIKMTSEQFLGVAVDQRGIDVALTLFGPDGKKISDVDNIQSERGSKAKRDSHENLAARKRVALLTLAPASIRFALTSARDCDSDEQVSGDQES